MEMTMGNENNEDYTGKHQFESAMEEFVAAADKLFTIEGMERPEESQ